MIPRTLRVRRAAIAAASVLTLLSACTASVPLEPAPFATDPACAEVVVHLPSTVAALPARETNAQGTGAWGNPAAVLLHCGVDVPGPTTLPCININGVDWIQDDSDAPRYRFTTYGREPAVEVVLDAGAVSGSSVLVDLADAVSSVPAGKACTGIDELVIPSDGDPAATPPEQ